MIRINRKYSTLDAVQQRQTICISRMYADCEEVPVLVSLHARSEDYIDAGRGRDDSHSLHPSNRYFSSSDPPISFVVRLFSL